MCYSIDGVVYGDVDAMFKKIHSDVEYQTRRFLADFMEKIETLARNSGVSWEELATRCGWSVEKLTKILSIQTKITPKHMMKLAIALDQNIVAVLGSEYNELRSRKP